MPASDSPYLSVVVTSRNDDHGKNLLHRMQIFVSGFIEQCGRFNLPSELIIVEWNPPADKPALADALHWPVEGSPCTVRIITVPSETHRRFKHAEALPVFQMIAKNVGIRRARGQFILATNIDLLFSNELMRLFAERRLQRDVLYRMDRIDVPADVPLHAPVQEQLAYCAANVIRVNSRLSTISLPQAQPYTYTPSVEERLVDILPPRALLAYCRLYEDVLGRFLKWLAPQHRAYTLIERASQSAAAPKLTTAPGPAAAPSTPRTAAWQVSLKRMLPNAFKRQVKQLASRSPRGVKQILPAGLKHRFKQGVGAILQTRRLARLYDNACLPHLYACGDFTLMARELWFTVHGYPEYEIFSMHLDSVLLAAVWFRGVKEIVLRDPMRVYHVEHATGSGYTPDGWSLLVERLQAQGIEHMSYEQLMSTSLAMRMDKNRTVFNDEDWGLSCERFEETVKCAAPTALTAQPLERR